MTPRTASPTIEEAQRSPAVESVLLTTDLSGARLGLLLAEKDAPAGSLSSLTAFLNMHDVRAVPGYYGPNKQPILRLSNFENETRLYALLKDTYPNWARERGLPAVPMGAVPFKELGEAEAHSAFGEVYSTLQKHSGTISGGIYTAANLAYLAYAFRAKDVANGGAGRFDANMFASGMAFLLGGFAVLAHGNPARGAEDTYPLLGELYDRAKHTELHPSEAPRGPLHMINSLVKRYPWEMTSVVNALGVGFQLVSVHRRPARYEKMSGYLFLTSYLIAALVPEKGGRSPLKTSGLFGKEKGSDILERLDDFEQRQGDHAKHAMGLGSKLADFLHEYPVQVSGAVAVAGNLVSGAAAKYQNMPDYGRKTLGAAAALSLAGSASQLLASKDRGATFDSVVSVAAEMIRNDPEMQEAPAAKVLERIESLALEMQECKDITHDKQRMVSGITSRLKTDTQKPCTTVEEYLEGFLPSERAMLTQSPFVSKHMLQEFDKKPRHEAMSM